MPPLHKCNCPYLIQNVEDGDVIVVLDHPPPVGEQIGNVGQGGGHPASPLVVELLEALGARREGVGGRGVLDPPALREQKTILEKREIRQL